MRTAIGMVELNSIARGTAGFSGAEEKIAETFGLEHFCKLPIDPVIAAMVDAGEVESVPGTDIAPMADVIEDTLKIGE